MTMDEYIKKKYAIDAVKKGFEINADVDAIECCLIELPPEDVAEIVRCKDCKHYVMYPAGNGICELHMCEFEDFEPNDYCSYGERREDG